MATVKSVIYYLSGAFFALGYWPVLILLTVCVHFIRIIILGLSKLNPSLGRMLSFHSSFLALDTLDKNVSSTLMPCLLFDGVLDFVKFRQRVENILYSEDFAELKSTLTWWMGFYFWKSCETFSLNDHMTLVEEPIQRNELLKIEQDLSIKPYSIDKPLWEFIVFTNVIPDLDDSRHGKIRTSVIMFRIHHCLADGYSILKIIDKIAEKSIFSTVPKPDYPKKSNWDKIKFWIRLIFSGPLEFLQLFFDMQFCSSNWSPPLKKSRHNYNEDWTDEVSFDDMREIAKSLKVPTSVIIFSAYTGAIRKIMLERGEKIPKKFIMTIPFPMPGHPNYPTNHMLIVHYYAPLEIQDPIERLKETSKRLEELKNSPVFLHFHWWTFIYGYMAGFGLLRPLPLSPILLNNFPGPRAIHPFLGVPMLTFNLEGGIPLALCSASLCSHSYGGRLILRVVIDTVLYKDEMASKKMLRWAVEEIRNIKNVAQTTAEIV